ncbi:MAG: 2-C-methyl-D-erythritol 4-phosphate cytidylyltransferase [Desulfobacteraceae bacterium]|nr:2-C-methyl-D-erythritol 4-phosphate cytidylyltransferase [Desulfobacteraceae bacterium]
MRVSAIIAAAGDGLRFGGAEPKQFTLLGDRPILAWSLAAMSNSPIIDELVVVSHGNYGERVSEIASLYAGDKRVKIIPGGATRQESIRAGLMAVDRGIRWVAVHDAARPFVTTALIEQACLLAREVGAAIPVIPISDTVKEVSEERFVTRTVDRARLLLAQTPQVCKRDDLARAYEEADGVGFKATDEASLLELAGISIGVVDGSPMNLKVTTQDDLSLAIALIKAGFVKRPV